MLQFWFWIVLCLPAGCLCNCVCVCMLSLQSLEQQVAGLQSDIEQLRQKQAVDTTSASDQLLELQTQ